MLGKNVETFIGCDSEYEDAKIVLFGAPFDSTTSFRPGARFGSSAIRHESFGLETYSPYQDKDLTDYAVFDSGDLELCFGSAKLALADIEARAEEILSAMGEKECDLVIKNARITANTIHIKKLNISFKENNFSSSSNSWFLTTYASSNTISSVGIRLLSYASFL